jgi:glycine/D-amino acid oxidase-like deaminating enzyme
MRVAVLGGGIQGCCLALELAQHDVQVDVIEAAPSIMTGASRNTEGKIHLGFVWANDPSLRTADVQMRAALSFQPLLRRWLGDAIDDISRSDAFRYAVHRDSAKTPDELAATYALIGERMRRLDAGDAYFGIDDPHRVDRLSPTDTSDDYGPAIQAVFATREVAVDPEPLADLLVKRVTDSATVQVLTSSRVESVDPRSRTVSVRAGDWSIASLGPYDHVANCAWTGRLAIDATVGLAPPGPWTFRMKHFLRIDQPADLAAPPSTTVVLGPFGDVVDYGSGDLFLSWYPVARTGWSTELTPPEWPSTPAPSEAARLAAAIIEGMSPIVPAVASLAIPDDETLDVRGGVIYALGASDVDDPASRLHERVEIGITSRGWYHSIDTGKYTTAPLHAAQAAARILDAGR